MLHNNLLLSPWPIYPYLLKKKYLRKTKNSFEIPDLKPFRLNNCNSLNLNFSKSDSYKM